MKLNHLLCTALVVAAVPAAAQPQTTTVKKHLIIGDETVGGTSGNAGSKGDFVRATEGTTTTSDQNGQPTERYRITTLAFSEQSDRPCWTTLTDSRQHEAKWDTCKGYSSDISEHLRPDKGEWFSGVQVCLNKTQDRVKGVRLFASKFDAQSGILERTGTTKSFKRANCDEKDGCSWPTTCSSTRPRAPSAPTSPHQGRVGGRHHQQHLPGGFGVKAMNLEGNSFLVNWPYNPDPDSSNVGAVELYHKECCGELNVEANLFAFNPGGAMQHDWAEDRMPKFTVKDNLFFMNATLFGDARGEAGLFVGKFGPSPKHNVITVEQAADDYGYKMSGNVSFDPKVPVTLVELKAADVSGVTAKKSVMNDVRALFGANLEGDTVAIKNFAPAWPSTRRPCPFRRSRRRRPTAPRRPG